MTFNWVLSRLRGDNEILGSEPENDAYFKYAHAEAWAQGLGIAMVNFGYSKLFLMYWLSKRTPKDVEPGEALTGVVLSLQETPAVSR